MGLGSESWARTILRQQVEIFGEEQVSLDSLWRAVGSPRGHDPRRWAELAAPLLAGYATYLGRLDGETDRAADPSRSLWIWRDDSKDPWRTGDLMTHELIASAYASYLDGLLEESTTRPTSTLACS